MELENQPCRFAALIVEDNGCHGEQLRLLEMATAEFELPPTERKILRVLSQRLQSQESCPAFTVDEQDAFLQNPSGFISNALRIIERNKEGLSPDNVDRRRHNTKRGIQRHYVKVYAQQLMTSVMIADSCRAWQLYVGQREFQPVATQDIHPQALSGRVVDYAEDFLSAARHNRWLRNEHDGRYCSNIIANFRAYYLSPQYHSLVKLTGQNAQLKVEFWHHHLQHISFQYRRLPKDTAAQIRRYYLSRPLVFRNGFDPLDGCRFIPTSDV